MLPATVVMIPYPVVGAVAYGNAAPCAARRNTSMTKWEYGSANYDGALLDPVEMADMPGPGSVGDVLKEAGQKGWELCGVIPAPAAQPGTGGVVELTLIFKRSIL